MKKGRYLHKRDEGLSRRFKYLSDINFRPPTAWFLITETNDGGIRAHKQTRGRYCSLTPLSASSSAENTITDSNWHTRRRISDFNYQMLPYVSARTCLCPYVVACLHALRRVWCTFSSQAKSNISLTSHCTEHVWINFFLSWLCTLVRDILLLYFYKIM